MVNTDAALYTDPFWPYDARSCDGLRHRRILPREVSVTECPICNWDIGTCEDCAAVAARIKRERRNRIGFRITAFLVAVYLTTLFGIVVKQTLHHS